MRKGRFEKIERVFHAALNMAPEARPAYVARQIPDDADLRREVEALLSAAQRGSSFLETSLLCGPAETPAAASGALPERMIGPYRLIRELGRGGMGVVYEAEQSNPRRRVALKLVDAGLGLDGSAAMSGHEPRILGRLNHPAVATIYDADQTADGRSYFVMELIEGERLDEYAEREKLSRRERLSLFCKVCDAIQHAHTKSVIHLYLKPSNILVARPKDAPHEEPQVKVVDFGVAAITGSDTTYTARPGDTGGLQGTLAYMSPEQRRGEREALDVRSDVYSLGVILFKLMTGELPYPVEGLSIPETWRVFADEQPRRPRSIDASVPTDVETIIRTATAEEPARRYQSVAELVGDIRRFLTDQPITARQPSKFYEWTKFAQRNKGLVATLCAILLGLGTTVVGTSLGLIEARRAKAELDTLADSVKFIAEYLATAGPTEESGGGATSDPARHEKTSVVRLRNALEVQRQAAERNFIEGHVEAAEAEYARLVKVATRLFPPGYWYVEQLRGEQGECLTHLRQFADAEELLLASYEGLKATSGAEHPLTTEAMSRLIRLYDAWGRVGPANEWRNRLGQYGASGRPPTP